MRKQRILRLEILPFSFYNRSCFGAPDRGGPAPVGTTVYHGGGELQKLKAARAPLTCV